MSDHTNTMPEGWRSETAEPQQRHTVAAGVEGAGKQHMRDSTQREEDSGGVRQTRGEGEGGGW